MFYWCAWNGCVNRLIERGFHRLKGAPLSLDPLFVKRADPIVGLTNLLSIAVRLLTLVEFVVRRNLKQNRERLVGLLPQNPKKGSTTQPRNGCYRPSETSRSLSPIYQANAYDM